jgi:hypothetical protein
MSADRLVLLPLTKDEAVKVQSALSYFRTKVYSQHRPIIDGILANLEGAKKDAA